MSDGKEKFKAWGILVLALLGVLVVTVLVVRIGKIDDPLDEQTRQTAIGAVHNKKSFTHNSGVRVATSFSVGLCDVSCGSDADSLMFGGIGCDGEYIQRECVKFRKEKGVAR